MAECPKFLPDMTTVQHYSGELATWREIRTLNQNLLVQARLLISGEVVIDPTQVITTIVSSERLEGRSVETVVADMHPNFALILNCQSGRPNGLFITINQIEPRKPREVESFNYKLDEDGDGLVVQTNRPFEVVDGIAKYRLNNITNSRPITTGHVRHLDALYSFIYANLVPQSAVCEPIKPKNSPHS